MGFVPLAAGKRDHPRQPAAQALQAERRRLCAAERGCRLELSGAGRGRRDDGPLRPHEFPAHGAQSSDREAVDRGAGAGRHGGLPQAADRRTVGRPEEACLPRPRAGAGRQGDPARRALHRRRRAHRGGDHRAAAVAARRRPGDAGLDAQSRQRAALLRPRRADQPHRALPRADGGSVHPGQSRKGVRRRARQFTLGGSRPARGRRPASRYRADRRRAAVRHLRHWRRARSVDLDESEK